MNRLFAWRYFHSPYSTQAIHLIAWVAITAIAVGTAALIIILSVFNGFEGLVKGLYGDFYASVKVVPAQGKTLVWSKAAETQWRQDPAVLAIAGVVEEKALLSASAPVMVNLLGIDSNYQRISPIRKYLRRGSFQLGSDSEPAVVMGSGVESALGLYNGPPFAPRLTVYLPNRAVALTEADGLQSANLEPAGVFVWQTEFDNGYAFTDRGFLQAMLDYGPREFTSIDVKTTMGKEDAVKQRLIAEWGSRAKVLTRYEQNSTLYAVMQNEKWIIYLL
ncbi:MAG: ABC transporter permease, partial [Sphingobacteriia bacterium]